MSDEIKNKIYQVLGNYRDPENNKLLDEKNPDIAIMIDKGNVNLTIDIGNREASNYINFQEILKKELLKVNNILSVNVILTSDKKNIQNNNKTKSFSIDAKYIIAIASGKGGVGKSTFSVNLAVALKKLDKIVGILDADIYGPSVPKMMGIFDRPQTNENKKLIPLENHGVECMSIGFLIGAETPAIWRGPMVMKALEQMFNGVEWKKLDYLIIDLPPGTGDAQLTLAQKTKLSGAIIISTPQDVALIDARKGINMFRKVEVPILGIVENMSYFICEKCNTRHEIFSTGGVKDEATKFDIPFLGEIPIEKNLRINSDKGKPVCISNPESNIAKKYLSIAEKIINN